YGTISLASAVSQADLSWSGRAHSAVADAVMTARVLNDIAEYWRVLQCEYNTSDGERSGGGMKVFNRCGWQSLTLVPPCPTSIR
ncbi:hypothetical protein GZ992_23300, partial [Salmonella enterica subsp. enterica serovar Infantis]|nr:hypothetical protein [Salmonella enterica subsp. enterica serovar Infantis]